MNTFTDTQVFNVEHCCKEGCGIAFAMTREFMAERRRDGLSFYCPNGHCQHYYETTEQKLKKDLEAEKSYRQWDRTVWFRWKPNSAARSSKTMAERGAKIKLRKRIAHGVCPCCHRTFRQLVDHIQNKHPDYKAQTE